MKAPTYAAAINRIGASAGFSPRHITAFDSSTGLLRALGRFLHGRDFPALGMPAFLQPIAIGLNWITSEPIRERIYKWGGHIEAVPPDSLRSLRAETVSRWMVNQYPKRRYPAIAIGSSNGAAIHLCAALGIPWLPQTFLVLVRHKGIPPDDADQAIAAAMHPAHLLLDANPELQLHHMRDPNQDRLMSQEALYFRIKRLTLGDAYSRFISECLEPGGTLILLESGPLWPTTQIEDRHIFQWGGLGSLSPWEYIQGSKRVTEFLKSEGSPLSRWNPPAPDRERPEAEWGFEPRLRDDVLEFAQTHGYRVRRILLDHPEDFSPFAADLYRWWYQSKGIPTERLIVESFFLIEPWWILKTGSIPLWLTFNTEQSAHTLSEYLDHSDPYDEIHLMLFSNGVEMAGLTPIGKWRELLSKARKSSSFLGVNPDRYPRDFETFVRYHSELKHLTPRLRMPGSLTLEQLDAFVRTRSKAHVAGQTELIFGKDDRDYGLGS